MTKIVATIALTGLFLIAGFFTGSGFTGRQPAMTDIESLRQMQPNSTSVWSQYLEMQEDGIEYALQRRPKDVERALVYYRDWPSNLESFMADAPETTSKGMRNFFTPGMLGTAELEQLDSVIGEWMRAKPAAAELDIKRARENIAHSLEAVSAMTELQDGRERKQRTIGQVVAIIIDVILAQEENGVGLIPPPGKGDRLPGASLAPTFGEDGRYATRENLENAEVAEAP